ncbi:MAG: pseudouridine synthase, partial [Alphaproteobacteria bacterium]|nr:pseudouridine synthase [Alphaproteobacteria bacterium]
LLTTAHDPEGRETIYDKLPRELPRLMPIGRLDLTSEGLLLLTNDGALSRRLEMPATGLVRQYRVRAYGKITQAQLDTLKDGIKVEGIAYGPIRAVLEEPVQAANVWIDISLQEGKNREIRRVLDFLGLTVNRLIRTAYGPFELGKLAPGAVEEVGDREFRRVMPV